MSINVILTPLGKTVGIKPLKLLVKKFNRHVIEVIRVDYLQPGTDDRQVIGTHVFIVVVKEPNSIGQLTAFVNEHGCTSGNEELESAAFKEMMDCLLRYVINPVVYCVTKDDTQDEELRHQWNNNGWGDEIEEPYLISFDENSNFSADEKNIFLGSSSASIAKRVNVWSRLILETLAGYDYEDFWKRVWSFSNLESFW